MNTRNHKVKVCIVGLGPAGLGAAFTLVNSNLASNMLCIDAGDYPDVRFCSVLQNKECKKEKPCKIISGFGGCSLFGGKISDFPAGSKLGVILRSDELAKTKISEALHLFSSYIPLQKSVITPNDVKYAEDFFKKLGFKYKYYDVYLYNQEKLREVYQKISIELESKGILLLNTELIDVDYDGDAFNLRVRQNNRCINIFTKYLILGVGRLGWSMLRSLNSKLNLNGKTNHIDVGVRLEFPTNLYPDIIKYHADLKLQFDDARTFCVCKDGKVVSYRLEGMVFTEGSYNPTDKTNFTNLSILIRLEPIKQNEEIFDEITYKLRKISSNLPVCQMLSDYLRSDVKNCNLSNNSMSFGIQGDIDQYFPEHISVKIKKATHYFVSRFLPMDRWNEVKVFAPEVSYNGLFFPVNPNFSIIPRLYLIGDCTGRFRGILQAFSSGIICAESIIGDENGRNL